MRAMILAGPGRPLLMHDVPRPEPGPGQVLVEVSACGVCRTDLHVCDGELPRPKPSVIPGHEIVGRVVAVGAGTTGFVEGQRVGIPWLGWTCGECKACRAGRENLCDAARFTGYTIDGGYAEYAVADARYCFALPEGPSDAELAPLLCAGLIGYRSLRAAFGAAGDDHGGPPRVTGDAQRVGLYGFGAAAHIVAQVARWQGREVHAFVRTGDEAAKAFALRMGATWAGDSDRPGPEPLDAAILYAPVGALVPAALRAVRPGGVVVCAGIHMSDIPSFPYELLWRERSIVSVANLTRKDGEEFLALAPRVPVRTSVVELPLERANEALQSLREGRLEGAAVLRPKAFDGPRKQPATPA